MRRGLLLPLVLAVLVSSPRAIADDDDGPHVAWFRTIPVARDVASQLGRPIFLAVHPRVVSPHTGWPLDRAAWSDVYGSPQLVDASRAFACVLHMVGAPPAPGDPQRDGRPQVKTPVSEPVHLVLDASARVVLARVEGWTHEPGEESVQALLALFAAAMQRADPIASDAPLITPERVPAATEPVPGSDPLNPAPVAIDGPGFRTRLRWQLPVPEVVGDPSATVPAAVSMYWDGVGPFPLGEVEIPTGTDVDIPLDVRFADHETLAEHLTRGRHRVDVYIEPVENGFPFSDGPLHVGLVWIELGDGDGGGGGGSDDQDKPEEQEEPPPEPDEATPDPNEGENPPLEEAELEDQKHVVEPFMREGEEVEKEDAIVAVEDENAGVKPPPAVPTEAAPRAFEKVLERSVAWERIPLSERDFLRRYFEALRAAAEKAESGSQGK